MISHKLNPGSASGPPQSHADSHRLGGADVIDPKPLIGEAMASAISAYSMIGYGWLAYGTATDVSSARDASADGIGFKQSSAASAATGGVYNWPLAAVFDTAWLPKVRVKVKLDTVATVRYFFGLSSDTGANTVADDDPATYQCGIQFSTARGDTNWQLALDDNGTQVLTDTGLAAAAGVYWFEVDITAAGSCKFTIQDGAGTELYSATISANVPSAGAGMYFVHGGETQAAVAINPITYKVQAYSP